MRLYLATSNPHKIQELHALLAEAGLDIEVQTAEALGGMPEVVEDQDSFTGNALKKARALAALLPTDGLALADDSGICAVALDHAPGVYSARYAGENASDLDNLYKLLDELDSVQDPDRAGYFACHLASVDASGEETVFVGECHGNIIRKPRGENGFGYDPVFVPLGHERTTAEMSQDEKAELSHRGIATRKFIAWLKERLM